LEQAELPPFVFAFRWVTLLFAQDALLPDVVRLWDSLIADPRRFEFCIHNCLAIILAHREDLLRTDKAFTLAEILQGAPRETDFDLQVRRAMAITCFERRRQTPPFPVKTTLDDLSDDLREVAQIASARAQEAAAKASEVSRHVQENIAPVVIEKASQASAAASVAATEAAAAAAVWYEETAPARKEAMEKASTHFSSLWSSVRATAAATSALAMEKGQRLAAEYGQTENVDSAAARVGTASESAASGLTDLWGKASAAASAAAEGLTMSDEQAQAARTSMAFSAATANDKATTAVDQEIPTNFEDEAPQLCQAPASSSTTASSEAAEDNLDC